MTSGFDPEGDMRSIDLLDVVELPSLVRFVRLLPKMKRD
jgi:hypothetical protein